MDRPQREVARYVIDLDQGAGRARDTSRRARSRKWFVWTPGRGERKVPDMQTAQREVTAAGTPDTDGVRDRRRPGLGDTALLRLGAVTGIAGIGVQIVMGFLHPHREQPNDSVAAFREYAESGSWVAVHIGQLVGVLLIALTIVTVARSLSRQGGPSAAFAIAGGVGAVVLTAIFAVQMAVDGVALPGAIDAWLGASDPHRVSAFQVADGIRFIEKGLSGFFNVTNGISLATLGLAVAVGTAYRRWIGWLGVLAGVGLVAGGVSVAHTGFSMEAAMILNGPFILGALFIIALCVSMWRRSVGSR
jgi:hypothetical protein